jgi:hypothetical protein
MSLHSASPEVSLSKISFSRALLLITLDSELQKTQQNPRLCVAAKLALVRTKMSVKFKQWGQNIPKFFKCATAYRSSKHRQAQQLVLWAVNGTVWNPA